MNDKDFIKNEKVPMTKEEIRYVTMGYLDITSKKIFWMSAQAQVR